MANTNSLISEAQTAENMTLYELGIKVKTARKKAGLSQTALAAAIGLSGHKQISDTERGIIDALSGEKLDELLLFLNLRVKLDFPRIGEENRNKKQIRAKRNKKEQ